MKNYRLHWDVRTGWVIDVDVTLTQFQLARVCQWAIPRQIDRWRALPLGAKKDELGAAIKLLQQGRLEQRLVEDRNGTSYLFKSDQSTGKIISVGGI